MTLKAKLVNENSEMQPKLEAISNNHNLALTGSVNVNMLSVNLCLHVQQLSAFFSIFNPSLSLTVPT
jgi:hypothetical protein